MATIILNQKVTDYESWKTSYDADQAKRKAIGIQELAVGKKNDDPGMAYMIWRLEDNCMITKMLCDPKMQYAMEAAGVFSQHGMIIIE